MAVSLGDIMVSFGADLSGLSEGVTKAKEEMASLGETNVSAGIQEEANKANESISSIAETTKKTEQETSGGFGSMASSAMGFVNGLVGNIQSLQAFGQMTGQFIGSLLSASAQMEQNTKAFTTLTGSGEKATAMLQQLNSFAAQTPFKTQEIDDAASKMLAFGFNSKSVIPMLTDIGDALSALGKSSGPELDGVVNVFGQIHAAGKLMTGDIMQLVDRGIPAWGILSEAMGKPIPVIQKMTSQGIIPADKAIQMLTSGMEKTFGGGMVTQATSFNGLMSTIRSNIVLTLAAMTGPLLKLAEQGLNTLGNVLASPAFQDFATMVGQKVGAVLQQVAQVVISVAVPAFQNLGQFLQQLGPTFQTFSRLGIAIRVVGQAFADNFAPYLGPIGEQLVRIGKIITDLAINVFGKLHGAVSNLMDQPLFTWGERLGTLFGSGLLTAVTGVADTLEFLVTAITDLVTWLNSATLPAETIRDLLIGIGVAITVIKIGQFIATIPALIAGFIAWAGAAWTAAIATIAATWPLLAIGAAIAIVVAGIILAVQHWGEITKFLQGVWAGFSSWFMGMLGAIGNFFHGVWNGISAGFQVVWAIIVNIGKIGAQLLFYAIFGPIIAIVALFQWLYNHNYYFKALVDSIVGFFTTLGKDIQAIWLSISNWLAGVWKAIATTATSVWQAISKAIMSVLAPIGNAIATAWNAVVNATVTAWNAVTRAVSSAWKAISGVIGGAWNTYIAGPLGGLWHQFTGWFGNLLNQAWQWGANLISGFVKGILSGVGAVGSAISQVAGQVVKFLGFHSPPQAGPAKDSDTWAPNFMKMFSQGLQKSVPSLQAAVNLAVAPLAGMRSPNSLPAQASPISVGGTGGSQHITIMLDGRTIGQAVTSHQQKQVYIRTGVM